MDILSGMTVNKGWLGNLRIGDMALRPNGDIFVTAGDRLGVQLYLVRIHNGVKKAIASSAVLSSNKATGNRGVAVAANGDLYVQFPGVPLDDNSGRQPDHVFRFPGGNPATAAMHYKNIDFYKTMGAGLGNRLYLASGIPATPIQIISSNVSDSPLGLIYVIQPFPTLPAQQIHDMAVGPQGTLYVANDRAIDEDGVPTPPIVKVDRFFNVDEKIGTAAGDTVLPSGAMTSPANGQRITGPVTLRVTATDNSGQVQVQFRVDDADFGPLLTAAPFELSLDPATVSCGNHLIYAMLRDRAGNAQATDRVVVHTEGGRPNLDGEILVSDVRLQAPIGVETDNAGNVYVADVSRILKISALGDLMTVYGSTIAGLQNGDPATVRFLRLKGLGKTADGKILIVDDAESGDGVPYIRRLDPATGFTTTLIGLDDTAGIDVSDAYNVSSGVFEDLIGGNPICSFIPCDFGVNEAFDVASAER